MIDLEMRKRILARFKKDAEDDPAGFRKFSGKFRADSAGGGTFATGTASIARTNAEMYELVKADYERDYGITESMLEGVTPLP